MGDKYYVSRLNKDTSQVEPFETVPIPEGSTWLECMEQETPGFTDALRDRLLWRGPRDELIHFPSGASLKPSVQTHMHIIRPLLPETIDTTNRRIRRVLHCTVFYDEAKMDPEDLADLMIGAESTFVFPGEDAHTWRYDDVRWTAPHRVRIHLSRPLSAISNE